MTDKFDFESVYKEYHLKVYRLCLGYSSGDIDLAKEWQQETFIKIWKNRNSYNGNASIGTWIFKIAVNTCLSDLRSSKRREKFQNDLKYISNQESENETIGDNLKKMYQCINKLRKTDKLIIMLELEDVPQKTIAESIGIEHGNLRTRISRIRKALLKCIKNGN